MTKKKNLNVAGKLGPSDHLGMQQKAQLAWPPTPLDLLVWLGSHGHRRDFEISVNLSCRYALTSWENRSFAEVLVGKKIFIILRSMADPEVEAKCVELSFDEPPAKRPRFASVSEAELDDLLALSRSSVSAPRQEPAEATKRTTLKFIRTFSEYLAEKGLSFDFATGEAVELGELLCRLYAEVRQKNGQRYSRSSLIGFRAAIQRYLKQLDRDIDIFHQREFTRANEIFRAQIELVKDDDSTKPVQEKKAISDSDFLRLVEHFNTHHDPASLTEKVWFYVTYHFSIQTCATQAMLTVDDFEQVKDEQGITYFILSQCGRQKSRPTHRAGSSSQQHLIPDERIQAPAEVAAVKLLFSKLGTKSNRIFQMAKKHYSKNGEWFTGCPIGKNTMLIMMKRLSEKAGLSKAYSNSSVRFTCITHRRRAASAGEVLARSTERAGQSST